MLESSFQTDSGSGADSWGRKDDIPHRSPERERLVAAVASFCWPFAQDKVGCSELLRCHGTPAPGTLQEGMALPMISHCMRLLLLGLVGLSFATRIDAEDEPGFKNLFDGTSLQGWRGDETFWRVEDGAIVGESTAENPCRENTFLVWDAGDVDDFELRLQFRITGSDQANSGIQFRSSEVDGHIVGYQADIDRAGKWVGGLYDERSARKLLAGRGERTVIGENGERESSPFASADELFEHIEPDGWNDYRIATHGEQITLSVNGHKTAEMTDRQRDERELIGKLALQLHSGPPMKIEFRNIRMKRFPLEGRKKVVFLAGTRSHGYAAHEHRAGCLLLAGRLNSARERDGLPVVATVYSGRWTEDPTAFDNADTVVSYCDGGARHPLNEHLAEFDELMGKGVGLVCIHYSVETTNGEAGDHFLEWIGGYFEPHWSVNPHWTAKFTSFPPHPITRGVKPFEINDEWYYHMRFRPEMEGVTPILTDLPPRETLNRKDGPHSGNPFVREAVLQRKEPQHVAWAFERPEGKGRGFGFTGGHFHANWQNDEFRKVVLNAIVWTAGADVPEEGVPSETPADAEMDANQDFPKPDPQASADRPRSGRPGQSNTLESSFQAARRGLTLELQQPGKAESRDIGDAVAQLDVHEDLQVALFAGEPVMHNPTNIEIDHRGRVWVCEAINYRAFRNADIIGDRKEGDRILVLEDTDGDGQVDRDHTFYQGHDVDSAHGICVLGTPDGKGTRALVSALDKVFFLIDEDGDLKADRKEVLFTGIGGSQHDHGIHAFVFGPDGKLYFNFGNNGKQIRDKQGEPIVDKAGNVVDDSRHPYQQGMVFRCNLDGSDFETLAWNFRNNWEVCVDSFGRMWQSDNDDDGNRGVRINYVMEYGNYGYKDELTGAGWREPRTGWADAIPLRHWHLNDPGVVPNLLQTGGGSPTGICVYEGALLPELFRNNLIHCDAGPNVVRCYPVQADGAGFKAESVDVLVGTRDTWFRPTDVCVAPDGSLIVADWYDAGVGGHRMQDVERGRLFRLTPKGYDGKYRVPDHDFSTPEGAVQALRSPNPATRYVAWTALHAMGDAAVPALDAMFRSDPNERMRARAQWLLSKTQNEAGMKAMLAPLKPTDEFTDELRAVTLRAIRQSDFAGTLLPQGIERSPILRRELAIMLRGHQSQASSGIWARIAQYHVATDRWELEALGIGADGNWDARLAAWLDLVGDDWNTPAGRDIVWRSRADRTPQLLAEIIRDPSTPPDDLPRLMRAIDFQSSPQAPAVLETLATASLEDAAQTLFVNAEAFDRLQGADLATRSDLRASLNRVLDQSRGTERFVKLVQKLNVRDRDDELLAMAQHAPQSQLAADAVNVLLARPHLGPLREAVFGDDVQAAEAVLAAIGTAASGRSTGLLQELMGDEDRPLAVRRAAARALGRSNSGARLLRELAEKNDYDERLRAAIASALHAAEDPAIRKIAASLFPLPAAKDSEPLPPLSELLNRKGNIDKGRIVFHSTGTCTKCHVVNGLGREIGPNLSEIGKKLSRPAMYESVLYPSAGISHNYESWSIVTTEGEILNGLLVSETADELQLKDVNAIVHTVKTDAIELRKKQDVSLMPADLQKVMSAGDLIDVVEYMTTLKVRKQ